MIACRLPEVARFIRDARHVHADLYPELTVTFRHGATPELYIKTDVGEIIYQQKIDELTTDDIHVLLKEKGLRYIAQSLEVDVDTEYDPEIDMDTGYGDMFDFAEISSMLHDIYEDNDGDC